MAWGAAVDRHESDRQRHRAVFKFLDTTKDRGAEEEESASVDATTVQNGSEGEDEEYDDDDDEYYEEEYDNSMSGDYEVELPQGEAVTFLLRFLSFYLLL